LRVQQLISDLEGREGPLADRYSANVALALLALTPFLVITTAAQSFGTVVQRDLGLGATNLELAAGLANAGYAFGAVLAAQLVQRLPLRLMLVAFEAVFVVATVVVAAGGPSLFVAGRILQGIATGMLLIAALPPLVIRFGAAKLPTTAAVINVGLFGVVALGPLVGGLVAETELWRLFFWLLAGAGVLAIVLGVVTYEHLSPQNPDLPVDRPALALAALGCGLAFAGVSVLTGVGFASPVFIALVTAGVLCLVALMVWQYRARNPLMPVDQLSSTVPVAGIMGAMAAGGAAVALLGILRTFLIQVEGLSPLQAGTLFWPLVAGVAVAAGALSLVVRRRGLMLLAMVGILVTVAAGVVVATLRPGVSHGVILLATFLLGVGTGASVAPGLFSAAFSVPSAQIGRTFALVELLRSVAAFLLAPVVLALAMRGAGGDPAALAAGLDTAALIAVAVTGAAAVVIVVLFFVGGARLHQPNVEGWLAGEGTAFDSPPLAAAARRRSQARRGRRREHRAT